jgi:single-stranded DNA-binding protein
VRRCPYYDRTSNLWGNLARDVATYYKINDYILIEGYLSRDKRGSNLIAQPSKQIEITVLKLYPFLLSYDPVVKS